MKKRLNYLLLVLCLLVASACKNGVSTTASGKDEGVGGCEGEKAKAILWVDYKKGLCYRSPYSRKISGTVRHSGCPLKKRNINL